MAFLRRVGTAATVIAALVAWLGAWHSGWAAPASGAGKKPAASACDRPAFRVVVDVGHTAESPGAISARGVYEYGFNLRLATLIEQKLLHAGFAKTILLVEPTRPFLGTVHLDALPYKNIDLKRFYPYGNPTFPG